MLFFIAQTRMWSTKCVTHKGSAWSITRAGWYIFGGAAAASAIFQNRGVKQDASWQQACFRRSACVCVRGAIALFVSALGMYFYWSLSHSDSAWEGRPRGVRRERVRRPTPARSPKHTGPFCYCACEESHAALQKAPIRKIPALQMSSAEHKRSASVSASADFGKLRRERLIDIANKREKDFLWQWGSLSENRFIAARAACFH